MMIGTNFIAGIAVLGYLGHLLDNRMGHEFRYMIAGSLLGILWAMYEAIKLALWISREEEKPEDNGSNND